VRVAGCAAHQQSLDKARRAKHSQAGEDVPQDVSGLQGRTPAGACGRWQRAEQPRQVLHCTALHSAALCSAPPALTLPPHPLASPHHATLKMTTNQGSSMMKKIMRREQRRTLSR
jgi:hypothetical protein